MHFNTLEHISIVLSITASIFAIITSIRSSKTPPSPIYTGINQINSYEQHLETHYHVHQVPVSDATLTTEKDFCEKLIAAIILTLILIGLYYRYQQYIVLTLSGLSIIMLCTVYMSLYKKKLLFDGKWYFVSSLILLLSVISLKFPAFPPEHYDQLKSFFANPEADTESFTIFSLQALVFPLSQLAAIFFLAIFHLYTIIGLVKNNKFLVNREFYLFTSSFSLLFSSGVLYQAALLLSSFFSI